MRTRCADCAAPGHPPQPRLQRLSSPTRVRIGAMSALARDAADPGLRVSVAAWANAALQRQAAAFEAAASRTGERIPPPPAPLPAESEAGFRAALRDGVTLCGLANALRPGVVSKASLAPWPRRRSCARCVCAAADAPRARRCT